MSENTAVQTFWQWSLAFWLLCPCRVTKCQRHWPNVCRGSGSRAPLQAVEMQESLQGEFCWRVSVAQVECNCVERHTEAMRAVLEGIFANSGACKKWLTSWELTPGSFIFCSWSNFLLLDLLSTNICWKGLFCKLLHYLFFTCDVMLF